jgi:hypothetical protein
MQVYPISDATPYKEISSSEFLASVSYAEDTQEQGVEEDVLSILIFMFSDWTKNFNELKENSAF